MALSQHMQEQYEQNRLKMIDLNRKFRNLFWMMLALGAILFLSAFVAGALSTMKRNQAGSGIFYNAMSAGAFQILLGLMTFFMGWLASYSKKRLPLMILMTVNFIAIISIIIGKNGTLAAANMIFLLAGIGMAVWGMTLCSQLDMLKEQPGYPLFSPEASQRAAYEVPLNVKIREAEAKKAMEGIGGMPEPVIPAVPAAPAPAPVQEMSGAPKPLGPTPSVRLPQEVSVSGPISLDDMLVTANQAEKAAPAPAQAVPEIQLDSLDTHEKRPEAALPQQNPAAMLSDMMAIPSHATTQGNPDMLPTPEDVRARLAAMKQARQEHHPENS